MWYCLYAQGDETGAVLIQEHMDDCTCVESVSLVRSADRELVKTYVTALYALILHLMIYQLVVSRTD